jgi:hypothetical protein
VRWAERRREADGDEDAIGDLIGLRHRLQHFTDLGIDALWVTPIYPSGGLTVDTPCAMSGGGSCLASMGGPEHARPTTATAARVAPS